MGSKKQTDKALGDAIKARRMKQIGFGIVVVVLVIVALALGLYFGAFKKGTTGGSN